MVLVEALASGTPVVAPASCGPAEIVDPSLRAATTCPATRDGAARALVDVARRPASARASSARPAATRARRALLARPTRGGATASWSATCSTARSPRDAAGDEPRRRHRARHRDPRLGGASCERCSRPSTATCPAAQMVVVDSGSTDGGAELARALARRRGHRDRHGRQRRVRRARRTPASTRPSGRSRVLLNPDVELLDGSLAELAPRGAAPRRARAPARAARRSARTASARTPRSSSPARRRSRLPRAAARRAAAARRSRAGSSPWRADEPRAVGWARRRVRLRAHRDAAPARPVRPARSSCTPRTSTSGLRATDAGIETWFWPAARVLHHGAHSTRAAFGGEPFELLARRRREVVRKWRGGAAPGASTTALQLATFANRWRSSALLGRPAARERRQIEALLRVRREQPPH